MYRARTQQKDDRTRFLLFTLWNVHSPDCTAAGYAFPAAGSDEACPDTGQLGLDRGERDSAPGTRHGPVRSFDVAIVLHDREGRHLRFESENGTSTLSMMPPDAEFEQDVRSLRRLVLGCHDSRVGVCEKRRLDTGDLSLVRHAAAGNRRSGTSVSHDARAVGGRSQ